MNTRQKSSLPNQGYRKQANMVLFAGLGIAMLLQLFASGSSPMGLVYGLSAGTLVILSWVYWAYALPPALYLFLFAMVFFTGGTFLNENGFSYLYLAIGFHLVIYETNPRQRLILFASGFLLGCIHLWQPHVDFAFAVATKELRFATTLVALVTGFLIVWIHLLAVRKERLDYKYMSETLTSYLDQLRASNLILLKFDLSGEVLFSNEAATRLFPPSKAHAASLPSKLATSLSACLSSGLSLERRLKIGERFFRFRFLPDLNGSSCHVVGEVLNSNHFISCEEEHLVLNALDASTDPILVFDGHLRTRYANRAARLLFGGDSRLEQQLPVWGSIWQEHDQALLMHQVLPTLKAGQSWLGEVRIQGCDTEKTLLLHLHRIDGGCLLVQISASFHFHTALIKTQNTMYTSSTTAMNDEQLNKAFSPKDLVNNLMHAIHLRTDMSRLCFSARIHHTVPQQLHGDGNFISSTLTQFCQSMLEARLGHGLGLHLKAIESSNTTELLCVLSLLETGDEKRELLIALGDSLKVLSDDFNTENFHFEHNMASDASATLRFSFSKTNNKEIPVQVAYKGSLRVLLVDDDPINLHLGSLMLERLGCKADRAEHGRQALFRMETQAYDLVFMDLQMPVMNGFDTARAMKTLYPEVQLVASSAHFTAEDIHKLKSAGFDGYIQKPFASIDLRKHLERCGLKDSFQGSSEG